VCAELRNSDAELDRLLEALANPHRREFIYVLGLHPWSVSGLAALRGLSLPAVHKHIKVLQEAGLITSRKRGRTNFLLLNRQSLQRLQEWVNQFHPYWGSDDATLDNYIAYLAATGRHRTRKSANEEGKK
jgi:DNA-binding transcriptional ArsR family regulator